MTTEATLRVAVAMTFALAAGACGLKGNLYIPERAETAETAAEPAAQPDTTAPADEEATDE